MKTKYIIRMTVSIDDETESIYLFIYLMYRFSLSMDEPFRTNVLFLYIDQARI